MHHKKLNLSGINAGEAAEKIRNDVCTRTNPYNPTLEEVKEILSWIGGEK